MVERKKRPNVAILRIRRQRQYVKANLPNVSLLRMQRQRQNVKQQQLMVERKKRPNVAILRIRRQRQYVKANLHNVSLLRIQRQRQNVKQLLTERRAQFLLQVNHRTSQTLTSFVRKTQDNLKKPEE